MNVQRGPLSILIERPVLEFTARHSYNYRQRLNTAPVAQRPKSTVLTEEQRPKSLTFSCLSQPTLFRDCMLSTADLDILQVVNVEAQELQPIPSHT